MDRAGTDLVLRPSPALSVAGDPYLQHLAALVLSHVHRALGFAPLTRIVLVCDRVVVFHLPLPFRVVFNCELDEHFSRRTRLTSLLIRTPAGCALIVDLHGVV